MRLLRRLLWFTLTLLVSAACLYYAILKIDTTLLGSEITNMRWQHLLPAIVLSVTALSLRSLRWHLVLQQEKAFPFSNTFCANAVGYFGNMVLPARAGELLRAVLLALATGMRRSAVFASAMLERILDAGVLLALAFSMLHFTAALPPQLNRLWHYLLPLVLAIIAFLFAVPLARHFWLRLISHLPLPHRWREKLQHIATGLLDGIQAYQSPKVLCIFLFLSFVIWCVDAAALIFVAALFAAELSLPQAIVFSAALGFASSLPSTPGFVGVFQAVAVLLLPLFGVSPHKAFVLVSFFQLLLLLLLSLFGGAGWLILRERIDRARLRHELDAVKHSA